MQAEADKVMTCMRFLPVLGFARVCKRHTHGLHGRHAHACTPPRRTDVSCDGKKLTNKHQPWRWKGRRNAQSRV